MAELRKIANPSERALFSIKAVHTAIFIYMSASVFYILYSGLKNRVTTATKLAVLSVLLEGVALLVNDGRCPLTTLAEDLGAEKGSVTDIFLPSWLAARIFSIFTPIFVFGLGLLMVRQVVSGQE